MGSGKSKNSEATITVPTLPENVDILFAASFCDSNAAELSIFKTQILAAVGNGIPSADFVSELGQRTGIKVVVSAWGLDKDKDIASEAETLKKLNLGENPHKNVPKGSSPAACPYLAIKLNVVGGTHVVSKPTVDLLNKIGGLESLTNMTKTFYKKVFANPHLNLFFADFADPHGQRLGSWVAEKMGGGHPWSIERKTRNRTPKLVANGETVVIHDRSSAHVAAWYSAKRPADKVGQHFKLDDCRAWMRLHFWACREVGLFEVPEFKDWYVRFIAHFVKVYERAAPQFARESARWSESSKNLELYKKTIREGGNGFEDILGLSTRFAVDDLPEDERSYKTSWPYTKK